MIFDIASNDVLGSVCWWWHTASCSDKTPFDDDDFSDYCSWL